MPRCMPAPINPPIRLRAMLPPPMKAMERGFGIRDSGFDGIASARPAAFASISGSACRRGMPKGSGAGSFESLNPESRIPASRSKQRRADPHQRRTFLDGELEVFGHAERQRIDRRVTGSQIVVQFAHAAERFAPSLEVRMRLRNRHQTTKAQPWRIG